MGRKISEERKRAYNIGLVVMIIGGILFLSVFVTAIGDFGDVGGFESQMQSFALRAFGGIILLVIGGFIRGIAARGLAGSGVILDPEKAREELEPYSRMVGGMVKDAVEETDLHLGRATPERVIMIKCLSCGTLNEENSKFCQECGARI